MSKKLVGLFKNVSEINPSEKLAGLILARIEKMQKRIFWTKITTSTFGAFASASATVYLFIIFKESLLFSEFWSIVSLIFSDATIVATHYQEFLFSLLESLPAMTFAIMLIPVFTLLMSIYFIFEIYNNQSNKSYKYYL